jgi:homopolymeric O-antigen transport system ATP-binding protein
MSSEPVVIRAEGVGKEYLLGRMEPYKTLRDLLTDSFAAPYRKLRSIGSGERARKQGREKIWALRDVSFDIHQGEVVGIIGANGAGKSTLLKVLARITEPTEGQIALRGRIGSLLEVGTGFHPELTGRENVYLNGAILGMRRSEIRRRFDEIVDFSGVEAFLDTPVKRYSSGMQVRLAFAVAAHLQPEILLVDEVLAVGDAEFQKKCLGKMERVTQDGRTVLFVSHNSSAIRSLCPRSLLIEKGRLVFDGDTDAALARYLHANEATGDAWLTGEDLAKRKASERIYGPDPRFETISIATLDDAGAPRTEFRSDEEIVVAIEYEVKLSVPRLRLLIELVDEQGARVLRTENVDDASVSNGGSYSVEPGLYRSTVTIPRNMFGNTTLSLSVALLAEVVQTVQYEKVIDLRISFQGYNGNPWSKSLLRPALPWTNDRVTAAGRVAAGV